MSADGDLLAFVLRRGAFVARVLRQDGSPESEAAARDLEWLLRVNRRDWSHEVHSFNCMSDSAEAHRGTMTRAAVEANHQLHLGHVNRIESALRGVR